MSLLDNFAAIRYNEEMDVRECCARTSGGFVRRCLSGNGGLHMLKSKTCPACPVETTLMLIGGKWKILIMRNLLVRPWRFNELQKSLAGISQKVLTDSLRAMEADGIVIRTVFAEVPPRVEYSLSDLGASMKPILDAMANWGTSYQNTFQNIT